MNHGKCAGRPETCTLLRRKGRKRRGKLGKAGGSVQEGGEHAHFSGETGRNRGKTGGSVRGCIETCTLLRRKGRKRRGKLGEAGGSVHDSPETCTLLRRKGQKRRGKRGKAGGSVHDSPETGTLLRGGPRRNRKKEQGEGRGHRGRSREKKLFFENSRKVHIFIGCSGGVPIRRRIKTEQIIKL